MEWKCGMSYSSTKLSPALETYQFWYFTWSRGICFKLHILCILQGYIPYENNIKIIFIYDLFYIKKILQK